MEQEAPQGKGKPLKKAVLGKQIAWEGVQVTAKEGP